MIPARAITITLLATFMGCASEVTRVPSQLTAISPADSVKVVLTGADVEIRLDTSYIRSLKHGSAWIPIGKLSQGVVYKPVDTILTVEGAHIYEAYIVVEEERLTGFYLPVEKAFTPVSHKPLLKFSE